jgi:segregation and condensation protein B
MLSDEILKALIEGIVYVAPEPVTLDAIVKTLEGEERERVKTKLEELVAEYEKNEHGIHIRPVANGYKFSTKVEHHEILRNYVKSLKPPIRLSKPALETLAVIAYRQPVTIPEIEEIRGVDAGGVIHTLLEKKLVVTSGRKSVVGRPILYRTSKDFLVHFGLKDVGELPSLKEFEELAKRALGSDVVGEAAPAQAAESVPPSGEMQAPAPTEPASTSGQLDGVANGEVAAPSTVGPDATSAPVAPTDATAIAPPPEVLQEAPPPVAQESAAVDDTSATEVVGRNPEQATAPNAEERATPTEDSEHTANEPVHTSAPYQPSPLPVPDEDAPPEHSATAEAAFEEAPSAEQPTGEFSDSKSPQAAEDHSTQPAEDRPAPETTSPDQQQN